MPSSGDPHSACQVTNPSAQPCEFKAGFRASLIQGGTKLTLNSLGAPERKVPSPWDAFWGGWRPRTRPHNPVLTTSIAPICSNLSIHLTTEASLFMHPWRKDNELSGTLSFRLDSKRHCSYFMDEKSRISYRRHLGRR